MEMTVKNKKTSEGLIVRLSKRYLLLLISTLILIFLTRGKWEENLVLYHTILEGFCTFFALGMFSIAWHNYSRYSLSVRMLGFGFLLVGILDVLHTYYFLNLYGLRPTYINLSWFFWILGRFMQVLVIFLSTLNIRIKINKFIKLLFVITISLIVVYISHINGSFTKLITSTVVSNYFRITMEIIIIALAITSLIRIKSKIQIKSELDYSYIFLSLLILISSEILFLALGDSMDLIWLIVHIFKIVSYYLMYKGVFISAIVYSYDSLEAKHKQLEVAYEKVTKANLEVTNLSDTLNDVLDALPLGVFMYDENSKINYLNKKFEEIFVCDRNDAIGITTGEFLAKFPRLEDDESLLSDKVLSGDKNAMNIIRTYRVGNGEYKKLSIKNNRINNGVLSLLKCAKEEQEIKNLHLQTETILNAVNNAIIMIDRNKKVVLCNKAAERIFEIDKSELLGMDIDKLNDLLLFEKKENPNKILSGEKDYDECEASLRTIKGNKVDLIVYSAPIKNIDGEIIGGISVDTDVTEIKRHQLAIQQQEKLALLGQMGAGIVHETRNFLTTIKGRCQLIEVNVCDKKIKDYANKINKDVDEVNRIISEFLFLSKPREVLLEEISMLDLFETVSNTIENTSLTKGVDVTLDISKEERYILCDEVQIKQVVLNICKNAVDAMNEVQNRKLKIETGFSEDTNEMYIKITDNGTGMSKEQLEKIGTMFYTTKKTGTGLGLNVCYQIIKDHKGRIDVESILGEGTTFTITLPCIDDEELDD